MNKLRATYLALFALLCLAGVNTSCQKSHDIYITKTSELNIPADFDWSMTKTVSYSISSPVATVVSIFQDKACSEDQLLATIPVSTESSPFSLELPTSCQQVYVQYPNKEGGKSVMTVNVTQTKADVSIILPEEYLSSDGPDDKYGNLLDNYFTKGTVLFEDNWPYTGDYDFNDFVAYYDICTKISRGSQEQNQEVYENEGMTIKVQFRAIGGSYKYQLGLQLDALPVKYIDSYELEQEQDVISVKFLNSNPDQPAVFLFEGTESLKGQGEAQYYNTEPGYEIAGNQLITATIKLKVNCFSNPPKNRALWASAYSNSHNFFLKGWKEIHLKGYAPTHFYENYEQDAQGLMSDAYYCDKDGLVWGIKVPGKIKHVIERTDISEAYPKFVEWVTSGGKENTDWYEHPVSDKVITTK